MEHSWSRALHLFVIFFFFFALRQTLAYGVAGSKDVQNSEGCGAAEFLLLASGCVPLCSMDNLCYFTFLPTDNTRELYHHLKALSPMIEKKSPSFFNFFFLNCGKSHIV